MSTYTVIRNGTTIICNSAEDVKKLLDVLGGNGIMDMFSEKKSKKLNIGAPQCQEPIYMNSRGVQS